MPASPLPTNVSLAPSSLFEIVSLEDYLQEILDIVVAKKDKKDDNGGCFSLIVTQQHRKSLMRGLLNITKVQMDQELRQLSTKLLWQRVEQFVQEHLQNLTVDEERAPQFAKGLEQYRDFSEVPKKLFSFIARGRFYKGQFERLLEDIPGSLLLKRLYHERVLANINERGLLEAYALEQQHAPEKVEDLLRCVHMELKQASQQQPAFGGKSLGQQGEGSLQAFLKSHVAIQSRESSICTASPVFIKVHNKAKQQQQQQSKSKQKNQHNVLELPAGTDWSNGMTSELDAIVVEVSSSLAKRNASNQNNLPTVKLLQVWEAKSTLHPTVLYEILTKKCRALNRISEHIGAAWQEPLLSSEAAADSSSCGLNAASIGCHLWTALLDDRDHNAANQRRQRYLLQQPGHENGNGSNDMTPIGLGILGHTCLEPHLAAQRTAAVLGERLLERCPDVAREALDTGRVRIPNALLQQQLETLLELVRRIQPICVVTKQISTKTKLV